MSQEMFYAGKATLTVKCCITKMRHTVLEWWAIIPSKLKMKRLTTIKVCKPFLNRPTQFFLILFLCRICRQLAEHYTTSKDYENAIKCYKEALYNNEGDSEVSMSNLAIYTRPLKHDHVLLFVCYFPFCRPVVFNWLQTIKQCYRAIFFLTDLFCHVVALFKQSSLFASLIDNFSWFD